MSLYGERITCGRLADDSGTPAHALPGDRPVWSRDRVVDVKHSKIDIKLYWAGNRLPGPLPRWRRSTKTRASFLPQPASRADQTIAGQRGAGREPREGSDQRRVDVMRAEHADAARRRAAMRVPGAKRAFDVPVEIAIGRGRTQPARRLGSTEAPQGAAFEGGAP